MLQGKGQDLQVPHMNKLNNEFNHVRIQVLQKQLSSLNETMVVFWEEEARRGVMLEPPSTENSTLLVQNKGKKV